MTKANPFWIIKKKKTPCTTVKASEYTWLKHCSPNLEGLIPDKMSQIVMRTEHRGSTDPGNRHGAVEGGVGPSPPSRCDPPPAPSWRSLLCYTWTKQNTLVFQYIKHIPAMTFQKERNIDSLKEVCWFCHYWRWALLSYFLRRTLVMCYHIFFGSKGLWRQHCGFWSSIFHLSDNCRVTCFKIPGLHNLWEW